MSGQGGLDEGLDAANLLPLAHSHDEPIGGTVNAINRYFSPGVGLELPE